MAIEDHEITLLVLLDFDTIDHQILPNVLENNFGISASALNWFVSYLSGLKQQVLFYDQSSGDFQLNCGIPQGSCLGPVLLT